MKTRFFLLASITLLASLIITGVVLAEGEVSPETPAESPAAMEEAITAEVAPPLVEGESASEEPAIAAEQPTEAGIPAEPAAAALEVQPEDLAIQASPVEEALPVVEAPVVFEAAPEVLVPDQPFEESALASIEPEIVLVDPAGEPLDMASQASAEAIASADPYFTIGLVTYRFSEVPGYCASTPDPVHCFDPSTTHPLTGSAIQFAIDYISNTLHTPPTNGLIYVEKALYSGNVTIDASAHLELATLKGLIGLADTTSSEYPTISGNVSISHLTTGFTLSGFTINGSVDFDGNVGTLTLTDLDVSQPAGGGIRITAQTGNVVMTNVRSSHSTVTGAIITNTNGGNVTITNSAFDDNSGDGLRIQTNGVVTINGISASQNINNGINASDFSSLSLKNAVMNGGSISQRGLYISSSKAAPVVVQNVTANKNVGNGISITTAGSVSLTAVDACYNQTGISINNTSGVGAVTLNTITASDNNNMNGITISSKGAITLTSVRADNNSGYGASLDNSAGTGSVTVTSLAASGVAGANSFSGNIGSVGLWINSSGAVTVTNTNASHNGQEGLLITNTTGTISINKNLTNWVNDFSGNSREGIKITTQGIVNISSSKASYNQWTGIDVTGKGAITLTDVAAFNNGLAAGGAEYSGLKLTNIDGTGGVTIKSSVAANYFDFSDNYTYGIAIYSKGAVSVSNVTVNNTLNRFGLLIENQNSGTSSAVIITNGQFDLNNWSGIDVTSKGIITLTNVSATNSKNNYAGVNLDNLSGTSSGITIKSSSSFSYEYSKNTGKGIEIYSNGAVAISNVIAEGNGSDGINIQNNTAGSNLSVAVNNSIFNGNGQNGLSVVSRGAITLTNVGAHDNIVGAGAILNNWAGGNASVTIRSTSATAFYDFSGNGLDGIYIFSYGAVSLGNITANDNDNYGLNIDRNVGTGAISLTRGTFDRNDFGGIRIYTTPFGVTLTDVTGSYNGIGLVFSGAYIEDGGTVVVRSSTSAGMYAFSHNTDHGLDIVSTGSISVSNVIAEGNGNTNINLQNQTASSASPKPVSVAFSVANSSTNGYGFSITTRGNVTLNTLTAIENLNGYGLYVIARSDSLTPATVTMTGARNEFSSGGSDGVYIETEGNITLANIIADNNSGKGIYLNSSSDLLATGNVTISASTNFWNSSSGNDSHGLEIRTRGIVTLSRVYSNENWDYGIFIQNNYSDPLIKNVTLTSVDSNRNRGKYGLYIISAGSVTLNSTRADSNEQNGLEIHTKGLVTFNGVSASYNSIHDADIPAASATIAERLTSDSEGDIWHFVGATSAYTFTLTSPDFDAYLKLFHLVAGFWDLIASNDNSAGGSNALISIPGGLVNGDEYYILATTANGWGIAGDYILSFNGPGTTYLLNQYIGARIDNQLGSGNVTITSPAAFWSSFNENNAIGLLIATSKALSITNADVRDNASDGLYVSEFSNPTSVTIRNTLTTRLMSFSGNGGSGIKVPGAFGAITISGLINASNNGSAGAYLFNAGATTPMAVNITSLTTDGNQGEGIYLDSKGAVTLTSITANGNQSTSYAVYIRNNASGLLSSVTINGINIISSNNGDGLNISTNGTLSITGVRAENNSKYGLVLASNTDGKIVTLSNIIAQYNGNSGVLLDAKGTTTLTNVRSCANGTTGISADGIKINMTGAYHIYINNSSAIGNTGYGIDINKVKSFLHLVGTYYFGNNSDNVGSEKDLFFLPPPP